MFFLPALLLTAFAILCVLVPLSKHADVDASIPALQRRRAAALITLFFIPLFTYGLYSWTGQPQLGDMPLKARRAASLDEADFMTLISRLEQRLQKNGEDAQGWILLARSYRSVDKLKEAAHAYREAVRLKSDDIPALSGLAEVLSASEGRVTAEAQVIFKKILQLDSKNPEARFFLSKAKIEAGDKRAGLRELKALLAETPESAPWRALIQKEIGANE